MTMITTLKNDENGFIVSAELILVATIVAIGLLTGMAELSYNLNQELEDAGSAIGALNQGYEYTMAGGVKGSTTGSRFHDNPDEHDTHCNLNCNTRSEPERM